MINGQNIEFNLAVQKYTAWETKVTICDFLIV